MSRRDRLATGRRRVNRAVVAIASEAFLSRLSFGVVGFALPLYALSLGMSVVSVGLLVSINVIAQLAAKPAMGVVADRIGHRTALIAAIVARSVIPLLLIMARAPWQLFAIRMLYGLAQSLRDPPLLAIIAEVGGAKRIASTFAWYQTAKNTAASMGRAAAAFLLAATVSPGHPGGSYGVVFVIAFTVSLLPIGVVIRWIGRAGRASPELAHTEIDAPAQATRDREPAPGDRGGRLRILPFTTLGFLFGTVAGMMNLFPVIAIKYMHLSEAEVGFIFIVSTVFVIVGGPVFGWLADDVSRKLVLMIRGLANAASSLMYLVFPTPLGIGISKTVDDLGKVAFRPAWGSIMAEVANHDRARRARVMSLIDVGDDGGDAVGPLLAGLLLSVGGLPVMLGVRVVLALVTEVTAGRATRRLGRSSDPHLRVEAIEGPSNWSSPAFVDG